MGFLPHTEAKCGILAPSLCWNVSQWQNVTPLQLFLESMHTAEVGINTFRDLQQIHYWFIMWCLLRPPAVGMLHLLHLAICSLCQSVLGFISMNYWFLLEFELWIATCKWTNKKNITFVSILPCNRGTALVCFYQDRVFNKQTATLIRLWCSSKRTLP